MIKSFLNSLFGLADSTLFPFSSPVFRHFLLSFPIPERDNRWNQRPPFIFKSYVTQLSMQLFFYPTEDESHMQLKINQSGNVSPFVAFRTLTLEFHAFFHL